MSEKNEVSGIFIYLVLHKKRKTSCVREKKRKKWVKVEQYELPEEAAGLSVVFTVLYIWKELTQKQDILFTKAFY